LLSLLGSATIAVMSIQENLDRVKARVKKAASSFGRNLEEIKLIAVTKTIPFNLIEQAIQAGVTDIGENKVQEALPKIEALKQKYPKVIWHMLGHLQRNKVRQALSAFDIIQSLDSFRLAEEIQKKAEAKIIPVLIEVNTSGEESKFGVALPEAARLVEEVSGLGNLCIQGLMTIGQLGPDPEAARLCFKRLKKLFDELKQLNLPNVDLKYLSMGMSSDFEIAIEEGSNMVRVGQAFFGKRS